MKTSPTARLEAALAQAAQTLARADMAVQEAYRGTDGKTLMPNVRFTLDAQQRMDEFAQKAAEGIDPLVTTLHVHKRAFNDALYVLSRSQPELRTELLTAMTESGIPTKPLITDQVSNTLKMQIDKVEKNSRSTGPAPCAC